MSRLREGDIVSSQDLGVPFTGVNKLRTEDIPFDKPFDFSRLGRELIGHAEIARKTGLWAGQIRLVIAEKEILVGLTTLGEGERARAGLQIGNSSMPVDAFLAKFAETEYSLFGDPTIILPEVRERAERAAQADTLGLGGFSQSYKEQGKEQIDRFSDVFERSRRLLLERAKKIGIMTASSSMLTLYASGISRAVMEEEMFKPFAENPSFTVSQNYRTGKNEQATHFVLRDSFARIQPFLRGAVTSWDELSAHSQQRAYLKHLDNLSYKPGQEFYYLWKSSKYDRDPGSCYISLKTPKKRK